MFALLERSRDPNFQRAEHVRHLLWHESVRSLRRHKLVLHLRRSSKLVNHLLRRGVGRREQWSGGLRRSGRRSGRASVNVYAEVAGKIVRCCTEQAYRRIDVVRRGRLGCPDGGRWPVRSLGFGQLLKIGPAS